MEELPYYSVHFLDVAYLNLFAYQSLSGLTLICIFIYTLVILILHNFQVTLTSICDFAIVAFVLIACRVHSIRFVSIQLASYIITQN